MEVMGRKKGRGKDKGGKDEGWGMGDERGKSNR
jgi:hypothetical protein